MKARWKSTDMAATGRAKNAATIPKETANGITAAIIRVVNMRPRCVAYRVNNVGVWDKAKGVHRGGNTEKGLPDIWCCMDGRFVVIEVKAGKDRQREEQKHRQFEIERAGGVYLIVRSKDEFLKWFAEFST